MIKHAAEATHFLVSCRNTGDAFSEEGISIACIYNTVPAMFWVAITASIFTGVSQSFGEAVFLGFLKGFPSYMIGYTSSGTGVAGIFATGTLLLA